MISILRFKNRFTEPSKLALNRDKLRQKTIDNNSNTNTNALTAAAKLKIRIPKL